VSVDCLRPDELHADRFHDECGVFGVFGDSEAANLTYLGLHGLQHRGQESAGIVSCHENRLHTHRAMGLVSEIFTADVLERLPGTQAIGHVRYSTAGSSNLRNCQPFAVDYARGSLVVAHNGTLTNAKELTSDLESLGSLFHSTSDTEIFLHLLAHNREGSLTSRLERLIKDVKGAFSLLVMTRAGMAAVRDPHGFRPLVIGRKGEATVFASETCALDLIGAQYVRDVEPGEIVEVDSKGLRSRQTSSPTHPVRQCIFEHVYFARPDSRIFGQNVYQCRKMMGRILARESPPEGGADLVIPVPDSGVGAANGYAQELNIPFEMGLIRSHYVGRTFIEPAQSIRHFGVKLKLAAVREEIEGRRVVVVDDSLIRGTTSRKIIDMLHQNGAKEVHVRISCPPTVSPCYFGIDTPTHTELIAANRSVEEIRDFLEADSLAYLSEEGLHQAVKDAGGPADDARRYCNACFTKDYPVQPPNGRAE
jgi:amidophosphoribosyltransferase